MWRPHLVASLALGALISGCADSATRFSVSDARAHLDALTISSRPTGSDANARARTYLVERLRSYGFAVEIQEREVSRADLGLTTRVANIVASRPNNGSDAIALVAHYDSIPYGPGAADDAFGTAVVVEAARALAQNRHRTRALIVLLTDGEEAGLMGASAVVQTDDFGRRVRAYLNVDTIGSAAPLMLFEAGPGNGWLLRAWALGAPRPRGASYAAEIYRYLPRDTDFSILKRTGVPGLNFALVGDGYAYHTDRDRAIRISDRVLEDAGATVIGIAEALDDTDLRTRTTRQATYFDLAGLAGVWYSAPAARGLTVAALLLGAVAWSRQAWALRSAGLAAALVTGTAAATGAIAVPGAMIAVTWLLRASREIYHPWYAHPDRLMALLAAAGVSAGWLVARLWVRLPWRGLRQPAGIWCCTLPIWMVLAGVLEWGAPGASFLVSLPLLAAAIGLAIVPPERRAALRAVSGAVLAIAGLLWLRDILLLGRFAVTVLGFEPMITPVWMFPAVLAAAGLLLAPPALALMPGTPGRQTARAVSAVLLVSLSSLMVFAHRAPAYTGDRPQRRWLRYVHDGAAPAAFWELAGNEPGLDLLEDGLRLPWRPLDPDDSGEEVGPRDPSRARGAEPAARQEAFERRRTLPFRFRATAPVAAVPAAVRARIDRRGEEVDLLVEIAPAEPGLTVSLLLPPLIQPLRSNYPGTTASGRWRASYVAPQTPVRFRVTLDATDAADLSRAEARITGVRLPGASAAGLLPPWAPTNRAVWTTSAVHRLPLGLPPAPSP